MAIARAPKAGAKNDGKVMALISGAPNRNQVAKDEVALTVRVPPDVLEQIDQLVKRRRVKIPRHAWLLEAIYAKLDSENGGK